MLKCKIFLIVFIKRHYLTKIFYTQNSSVWSSNEPSPSCNLILGPESQDADSDEEWPALGAAGPADVEYDEEIVVDAEDEKAIEMFMNKNPPVRWATPSL